MSQNDDPQKDSSTTESPRAGGPAKGDSNRRAKLVFLALVVAIAGVIWWFQREKDPALSGWGTDYNQAREQAQKEKKNVVIFFTSKPMTSDDKAQIKNAIMHARTQKALAKAPIITVHLNTSDDAAIARQFKVDRTPTAILLGSYGEQLNRLDGKTNDVDFYNKFLGLSLQE